MTRRLPRGLERLRPISLRQRMALALAGIVAVTVVGTFGYWLLEPWSFGDALYMTVMTLSTVGAYNQELSGPARAFTVVLVMGGMTSVLFALFAINTWLMEGTLLDIVGQRRMGRDLEKLSDHIIVCGAGRIGSLVVEDLREAGVAFVVIDHSPERVRELAAAEILVLEGNAGDEETLQHAGIERAGTLISVVHSDADNLYITITARSLNPRITIVCRAENEASVRKLKRVGADKVVAPYHLGAMRIANAVLRPAVTDVIESTTGSANVLGLQMGEIRVSANSRLAGKTLSDTHLRQQLGIMVIAVQSPGGTTQINPPADQPIDAGALLVVIGHQAQLDQLTEWATT